MFDVKINPCKVTTLTTGSYTAEVEYIVGNPRKSLPFTFTQAPCAYDGTYTMTKDSGASAPTWITQLERFPIFDIYTVDENHVGNYTLRITTVLDNLAAFAALDPSMEDYIANIALPPSDLLYTTYFDFKLEVKPPESDYAEPDNTPPYLLPPPEDYFVEVGAYKQIYLGDIIDQEIVN